MCTYLSPNALDSIDVSFVDWLSLSNPNNNLMMRRAGLSTMHCYGGKIIQHCNLLFGEERHSALIFLLIALLFLERGCFRCISTTLRWSPVVDCAGNVLLHCSQIPALPRTPLVCHSLNPNILVSPIFSSKFWIFFYFFSSSPFIPFSSFSFLCNSQ